jgi:hypothetical protein
VIHFCLGPIGLLGQFMGVYAKIWFGLVTSGAITFIVLCACMTWYSLWRAAKEIENGKYATGMLVLSIILTPCLYLGLLIIPERAHSTLERRWEKRNDGYNQEKRIATDSCGEPEATIGSGGDG